MTCRLIALSHKVLEPLSLELVEELVRSSGTTTAVSDYSHHISINAN